MPVRTSEVRKGHAVDVELHKEICRIPPNGAEQGVNVCHDPALLKPAVMVRLAAPGMELVDSWRRRVLHFGDEHKAVRKLTQTNREEINAAHACSQQVEPEGNGADGNRSSGPGKNGGP